MNKIEQFRITGMTISGFKSYEGPTELTFGDPTVITGGNGRGKTSIADAIAFAVTGLPFFGERGIDRLHNESKRAFLTEGPLKGDVASFLARDELFLCIGGVNALHGLTDTIRALGVREVVEAMDMDQMTNPNVRKAVLTMRREVQKIPGIRYAKYTWNPAYKGVDDYLLSRAATM